MLKKTLSNCLCVQGLIFFAHRCQARSPKTTLKFGGAGLDNNTARVLFHRPSTVVQYWYTEYTEYTGLVSPNIFQLTCKLDHLLETVRAFSLSLSLSLSPQITSVTKSLSELPIACLVCFTFFLFLHLPAFLAPRQVLLLIQDHKACPVTPCRVKIAMVRNMACLCAQSKSVIHLLHTFSHEKLEKHVHIFHNILGL